MVAKPGLIYHPHLNPATTLPATLLEATSRIHAALEAKTETTTRPDWGDASSKDLPPAYKSLAALLRIAPIHVDAVGESVCRSIEDSSVSGIVDVARMRRLLRFDF